LFITIHGRYAALVPRKYREFIDKLAREENKDPETVVKDLLIEAIEQRMRNRESSTGVFAVQESVRKENPAVNPKLEISIESIIEPQVAFYRNYELHFLLSKHQVKLRPYPFHPNSQNLYYQFI